MNYKELAKLAKACRKAGIKHYRCEEYEFTLTDEAPPKVTRLSGNTLNKSDLRPDKILGLPELSEEEILLWSAGGGSPIEGVG